VNKYIAICAAILFIYNGARAEELMTWDDCVKEAAKNHPELTVQIGTQRRSGKQYLQAKAHIDAGHLGKIVMVRCYDTRNWSASGDPFVNYAGKDFRLKVATVAGTSLSAPFNLDIIGIARGSDGTWDRGAYEFGGTATTGTTPAAPTGLKVN